MKLIVLSALTLLGSTTAHAQLMGCLGFPSGAKFTCTLDSGATYAFDIPDGFGCNQPPAEGRVNDTHTIYSPTTGFTGSGKRYVEFYFDAEKTDYMKVECADSKEINN